MKQTRIRNQRGLRAVIPTAKTFSLIGYQTVFSRSNLPGSFLNSIIVTVVSLFFVLLLGSMAAHALSEYRFKSSAL